MALNFPDSPTLNQIYTDSTSGFSYQWNGSVWISSSSSTTSNIQELDDISGSFNGVTTTFALTVSGSAVSPATTNQLLISVGGVMQNPTNDFYISGSNIIFTDAPQAGLTFFGILLGTALPLNTIADGSVSPSKLSTGGPVWTTSGNVGIVTNNPTQPVQIGSGSTIIVVDNFGDLGIGTANPTSKLHVIGDTRITGILTVGTGSITINGTTDRINVGTGLTLSSSGIVAGVITATNFVGNGSGLTGAGSTVADDTTTNTTFYPLFTTQTTGTVTASKVSTTKLSFNPSTGTLVSTVFSGSGASLTSIPNSATTATSSNTANAIVSRDASGNFSAGIITATTFSGSLSGNATSANSATSVTGSTSNGFGTRTVSTGTPSGGTNGDIWYKY